MVFVDVTIKVPEEMAAYLQPDNACAELERNALLFYPYIKDKTISHGKAAASREILHSSFADTN